MSSDELALLDRVFMRLASADTDEALQSAVSKYLPPVLLKLSSQQEGVRKKVMELLVHINKRIKNNTNILLPIDALLVQYQDPAATSFVTNFTIIYVKMGYPRLPIEKQAELVPAVLTSLDGKPQSHQDSLLLMIMPVLGAIIAPGTDEKKRALLGLSEKPHVAKMFHTFMQDYLLLPYGSFPGANKGPDAENKTPPGMSEYSWKRVSGETPIKAEDLEKTKIEILRFLGTGMIAEMDIAMHLLIGLADTRHGVASQADSDMRKLGGGIDWNDPGLVAKIYSLFLGTLTIKDKPPIKPEHKKIPANTRIRLKLMPYLLRSREAATQFPACIQVTFDLLFGTTGNTNAKLKMFSVSFIHQIIYYCQEQRLSAIGAVLLSALTRLVNEEKEDPKLRASCYVAIGKLGVKVPELVNKDVSMIQTFFEAMSREDKETQMSVQEALSLMAPSFRTMEPANLKFIEALLATYIENDEPQVRLVAVQYAGEVFDADHVVSRYILLLGSGDKKEDVAASARAHLYRAMNKANQKDVTLKKSKTTKPEKILPDFVAMLSFILDKASVRINTKQKHVIGGHSLAFQPAVYIESLNFLRVCMIHSAGLLPNLDMLSQPAEGAPLVSKYLQGIDSKPLIQKFVGYTEKFLLATQGPAQAQCLLQVIGCTPEASAGAFAGKTGWLKSLLNHTREDVRELTAQLYSVVVGQFDGDSIDKAVGELVRSFKEKNLEHQHGIVVCLGFTLGRKMLLVRMKDSQASWEGWATLKSSLELITVQLSHNHSMLIGASCLALSELGRCGPLPLPTGDSETDQPTKSLYGLVMKLMAIIKSAKHAMKVRERAALALGQMCIGSQEFPFRHLILENFLELAPDLKEIELHFTIGEAVVSVALGPLSPMGRDLWSVAEEDFKPLVSDQPKDEITWLLDELTRKHTRSTHPNIKQASCLWLLALVKSGKEHQQVKDRLVEIQSAFMGLLGDSNDFIQDAASKGLGLVYDFSTQEQRDQLMSSLIGTLMEGKREVAKVDENTKLFNEGEFGKIPSGGNLSTYKELCSLATDLNQPDLVYKFMHLANYNSMWDSKKGAAFGFTAIAERAGEQLEPHLPKIVPKLYRYQFDPTPRIQQSMNAIWHALVPETSKTVDKYLPEIMAEIQTNLTNNQWRVRESCCNALQDLLRGRTLETALDSLPMIWMDLFRVMDDIKESVRLSARKAVQTLSRTCIKMCDPNQGAKAADKAVQAILPPLLEKGLASNVAEVKFESITTLTKITRSAGPMLKPHLPELIPALIEASGEYEGKEGGYLSNRLANHANIQEQVDNARIMAAKMSPYMECVTFVLQYLDGTSLQGLVPRLIEIVKGTLALGSRGAAAAVVTSLTHQCPLDLQSFTSKLLSAFVAGLSDRNGALRKAYAQTIGNLVKTAKDTSIEKLFAKLRTWYMEKEEESSRWAVGYTFQAITRQNPDVMKAHAAAAMPIAFLAMHQEKVEGSDDVLEVWNEVWGDGTPGTEGGVRLYLSEIMALLSGALESPKWKLKAQAARAMGTVAQKLGDTIPNKQQREMLTILLNGLAGRTWTGKEAIIQALAEVCVGSQTSLECTLSEETGGLSKDVVIQCVLKECQREKTEYKVVAIEATGKILRSLKVDKFAQLYEIVLPLVEKKEEEDEDMETDDNEPSLEVQRAAFNCIGDAWTTVTPETQDKYISGLMKVLFGRVQATTKQNQVAIVKCLGEVMGHWKLVPKNGELNKEVLVDVAKILSTVFVIPKSSLLRTESLQVLGKVIKLLVECKNTEYVYLFRDEIAKSLDDVIKDLGSDAATKAMARDLKNALFAIGK